MEEKTLASLYCNISDRILELINLSEVLYDIIDGDAKLGTINNIIIDNLKKSFNSVEKCRKISGIQNWQEDLV